MPWPVVIGALFLSGGVWMMMKALAHRTRRLALLRDCVRTTGRVVRLDDTSSDGDFQVTYAPVARYITPGGRSHELRLPPRNDVSKFQVGAKVPVYYQRGDPANAIHSPHTWDINLILAASLVPILIGAGIFFTLYQQSQN